MRTLQKVKVVLGLASFVVGLACIGCGIWAWDRELIGAGTRSMFVTLLCLR